MTLKLFTKEKNVNAEEIKQFLPVNMQLKFDTIAPSLALVEQNYIIPILGNSLFDKLVSFYEADTPDEEYEKLLQFVQFSECRLAYWKGYNTMSVMITDKGASREVNTDKTLFKYERTALLEELKNDGFDQLDVVIEFLEKNIEKFPEFSDSEYYPNLSNSFIPNTSTFNKIFNINNSRLVFLKMKYFIRDVERIDLAHFLGKKFIDEILSERDNEKYKPIFEDIQTYIVYMSIAKGIEELHKLPTEKGLVFETTHAGAGSDTEISVVKRNEIQQTKSSYAHRAEQYMSAVINYLNENGEDYPSYIAFAGKNAPTEIRIIRDNTGKKTVVI
jgi:hypothetical protein